MLRFINKNVNYILRSYRYCLCSAIQYTNTFTIYCLKSVHNYMCYNETGTSPQYFPHPIRTVLPRHSCIHTEINPLNTKRRPLYLKTHFVPRSKLFLGYKNQSVYAVSGASRCLFSDKYKTHKYSVGRTYSC